MKQKRRERGRDPGWLCSLLPAVFFLLGVTAGILYAGRVSDRLDVELTDYLTRYLSLSRQREVTLPLVCATVWAYFRGPLLVFICGFTAVGTVLLPLTAAVCGFLPAYAAGCLAASFGGTGIWLALGLFGLRTLATLPCFFLLAAHAWHTSAALLRVSLGKGHPFSPVYDRRWWLCFAGVCLFLGCAVCAELRLTPLLTRTVLEHIF